MTSPTPLPPPPLTRWGFIWRNLLGLVFGAAIWGSVAQKQAHEHPWLFWIDLALGITMLVAYQYRRRWPFAAAMLGAVASAASASSSGFGVLAFVSLATRRRWSEMVPVAVVSVISGQVFYATQPKTDGNWITNLIIGIAFAGIAMAIGMYIGARRDLIASLKDRAERAEREQELHVARAQAEERTRIAREMHDVLAHRMSLVAMHAGALAYRDNLSPEETREAAEIIQANSHRALSDLREILGVLRETDSRSPADSAKHRPQPTLCDLDELIDDEQAAGSRIKLTNQLSAAAEVPLSVGRAAYRLVQESLTNARKHSPDTKVFVSISGAPGVGLSVEVRNPIRVGALATTQTQASGAGMGLLGLAERVTLVHGRFEHGRTPAGEFVVRAWLPWAA